MSKCVNYLSGSDSADLGIWRARRGCGGTEVITKIFSTSTSHIVFDFFYSTEYFSARACCEVCILRLSFTCEHTMQRLFMLTCAPL